MQQLGIYEQLITRLVSSRLDRKKFYVGERTLEPAEACVFLSRFLGKILGYAIGTVPASEDQVQEQIELANQLLFWLKDKLKDREFFEENLLDSQGKIKGSGSLILT